MAPHEQTPPGTSLATLRHIVLVGLMASGKTTIGRKVASRLGWRHVDSDAELEAVRGRTAREINAAEGIDSLHRLEAELLLAALAEPTRSVISAAASTIEDPTCREALTRPDVAVVWLRAEPRTLAARLHPGGHRPELGPDPEAYLEAQAARRNPLFESVHPIAIDIEGGSARELRDEILERLAVREATTDT